MDSNPPRCNPAHYSSHPPSFNQRRLFEVFRAQGIQSAVIHHYRPADSSMSDLALQMGTQVGGLLCDGLGENRVTWRPNPRHWVL